MNDYLKLKVLAEAATPGLWDRSEGCEVSVSYEGDEAFWSWESAGPAQLHGSGDQPAADADFIAAANPTAILGLLAEIDRLKVHDSLLAVWMEKTEWIQTTCHGRELGMHRADAILSRIDCLKAEVARLRTAEGDAMTYKAGMENVAQQRDQLKVEVEELKTVCGAFDRVNTKLKAENEALRKDAERYRHLMGSMVPEDAISPPRGLYVIFEDGNGFGEILVGEEASAEIDEALTKGAAQ